VLFQPFRRCPYLDRVFRLVGLLSFSWVDIVENCWAACVGKCSDKLSGEHLVSQSLFLNDFVTVQGMPWCKDQPKRIGLSRLTAKILCDRHNNALSPVDTAGAEAFATIRELMKVLRVRKTLKPHIWKIRRYEIDGQGLERWFLKTLINVCCNGPTRIGRYSDKPGWPDQQLVETAFGLKTFEGRAGLYSLFKVGEQINSNDDLACVPILNASDYIEGGFFRFRGFGFLLFLDPEGPKGNLSAIGLRSEDAGQFQLMFRQKHFRDVTGKYVSQIVTFRW
jgi:hypothetical protein